MRGTVAVFYCAFSSAASSACKYTCAWSALPGYLAGRMYSSCLLLDVVSLRIVPSTLLDASPRKLHRLTKALKISQHGVGQQRVLRTRQLGLRVHHRDTPLLLEGRLRFSFRGGPLASSLSTGERSSRLLRGHKVPKLYISPKNFLSDQWHQTEGGVYIFYSRIVSAFLFYPILSRWKLECSKAGTPVVLMSL